MRQTGYHALFGAKFLLAMAAFYFASALVGRGAGTQWVRNDRAKWLSVTLGITLAVVLLSSWMRQLHTGPNRVESGGVSMPSGTVRGDGRADVDGGEGSGQADDRYRDGRAGSLFRGPAGGDSEAAPEAAPAQ